MASLIGEPSFPSQRQAGPFSAGPSRPGVPYSRHAPCPRQASPTLRPCGSFRQLVFASETCPSSSRLTCSSNVKEKVGINSAIKGIHEKACRCQSFKAFPPAPIPKILENAAHHDSPKLWSSMFLSYEGLFQELELTINIVLLVFMLEKIREKRDGVKKI
nr:hypothetical protein Iba_chr04eCG2140 [Ipomoea batatas]